MCEVRVSVTHTHSHARAPKCVLGRSSTCWTRPAAQGWLWGDVFLASLAPLQEENTKNYSFPKEPLGLREDLSAKAKAEPQSREGSRGDG